MPAEPLGVPVVFRTAFRGKNAMLDLARQRRQMTDLQVAGRGVTDPLVLEAMRRVPRERLVAGKLGEVPSEESPPPIEGRQTISPAFIVAGMDAGPRGPPGGPA